MFNVSEQETQKQYLSNMISSVEQEIEINIQKVNDLKEKEVLKLQQELQQLESNLTNTKDRIAGLNLVITYNIYQWNTQGLSVLLEEDWTVDVKLTCNCKKELLTIKAFREQYYGL